MGAEDQRAGFLVLAPPLMRQHSQQMKHARMIGALAQNGVIAGFRLRAPARLMMRHGVLQQFLYRRRVGRDGGWSQGLAPDVRKARNMSISAFCPSLSSAMRA